MYGYADAGRAIEVVTIRVRAVKEVEKPVRRQTARRSGKPDTRRVFVDGRWRKIAVWRRAELPRVVKGPALVLDYGSTVLVPAGWEMLAAENGVGLIRFSAR